MTTIIRLKQAINNPNAPYLPKYDTIESRAGSLFLWDAGINPTTAFNTQAEAPTKTLTNVLAEYGNTILGTTAELNREFILNGQSAAMLKTEITSKGGLHCMSTQSIDATNQFYAQLTTNTALNAYMANKIANGELYVSLWQRTTRKQSSSGSFTSMFNYRNGNNYAFMDKTDAVAIDLMGAGSKSLKLPALAQSSDALVNQPQIIAINPKGATGTLGSNVPIRFGGGILLPSNYTMGTKRSPSVIYYRFYIEDLSLSGRTFEDVSAIDQTEFNKAFAVGGRFHGDTWSDPAVALP